MSRYFGEAHFSRPALAAAADQGLVAIFAVGFYLAFMVLNLIASIFRGVYRPMFARLRVEQNFSELQSTFAAISKPQPSWSFAAGSSGHGVALIAGRSLWPPSVAEAVTLMVFGAIVFGLGIRIGRVLGDDDLDLLRRANLPGGWWLIRFLRLPARHP